uniref:HTH_Tnp_Tc3_2 domain-containing protein n=1 Tax=Rhodnius prolixus TaxID=13249 RepID=T1HCL9_RHOPR
MELNETHLFREGGCDVGQGYEERGTTENSKGNGRRKKLNGRMKSKIKHEALKIPMISAQALADMVQSTSGISVSERTIRNALHSDGLHGRVPKKKPFIS